MMVNALAALTGAAYDPAGAAPTTEGKNDGFTAALENQLALLPLAIAGGAPLESDMPADATRGGAHAPDEEKPDDVLAALWLMPPPAVPANTLFISVPPPGTAIDVAAVPAEVAPTEDASIGAAESRAVTDMLRMIARPQADSVTSVSASAAPPVQLQRQTPQALPQDDVCFTLPTVQKVRVDEHEPTASLETASMDNHPPGQMPPASIASEPIAVHMPAPLPAAVAMPPTHAAQPMVTAHAALEPAIGTSAWQQALGHQLTSFTRNGVQHAELRLHPEELGPMQISLRLHQDQVQLHFVTDHHQVRAALEAAMPHLRSALAEAGIRLDQGSVGSEAPSWGATADSGTGQASYSQQEGESASHAEAEEEPEPRTLIGRPGISIFA